VHRAVENRRRVGILVSGGIDSSSVLAVAVALARGAGAPEIDAISLSFAGPGDDRPYLKDLCDSLGIVPLRVSPKDASGFVMRALAAEGAPFVWPTGGWNLMTRELARERGAEAVITGQAGDQLLNGDPRAYTQLAWSGHWFDAMSRFARFRQKWSAR